MNHIRTHRLRALRAGLAVFASLLATAVAAQAFPSKPIRIVAPFPAVKVDDVCIELTDGAVRFWAALRSSGPREYVIHEWEYGGYERSVPIPRGFGSAVEASLTNGQLVVRVLSGDFTVQQTITPRAS